MLGTISEKEIWLMVSEMHASLDKLKFVPNHIVVVMDGGMEFARKLVSIYSLSTDHVTKIKFEKYDVNGHNLHEEAQKIYEEGIRPYSNDRVLIVDDVIETGDTIKKVSKIVADMHPLEVMICAIIDKTEIDYSGIPYPVITAKTVKRGEWVKFYWENGN